MQDQLDAILGLRFDNSFVRELPGDPESRNYRRQVHGACYSRVEPTAVADPSLLAWSPEVAALVGLPEQPDEAQRSELAAILAGARLGPGMEPYAACYGGHQFGNWADQLGDGRAITLGEVLGPTGDRWELQLKGAGPTPYSRRGDGRAVLRSSVREFLCSEAMHHLGVPTTRALSLALTGEEVIRDMFYDGNARAEPGAVVCRVAPSFLRFGNFQLFAQRGDHATLRTLADYAISTHYPELIEQYGQSNPQVYGQWFAEVARRTAVMVAGWMRVGFVHGVMNTDNMSILGLTIDYGPYGWIDDYDPNWTPNTTDAGTRRYRFGNQPRIAGWNLLELAKALHPLVGAVEPLQAGMDAYADALDRQTLATFAGKLGLATLDGAEDPEQPGSGLWLVDRLLTLLSTEATDMTLFYRALAEVPVAEDADDEALFAPLAPAFYGAPSLEHREALLAWLRALGTRVRGEGADPGQRRAAMDRVNPKYVLRNYMAQEAIEQAEAGDPGLIHELLDLVRDPYGEQPGRERFAGKRPEWARHRPGCSMLSCSS
ncbi:MAG: YdiU family protein [Myxococcales bacterium]|nr:YdiU family protein [Myxococcales bacterium]